MLRSFVVFVIAICCCMYAYSQAEINEVKFSGFSAASDNEYVYLRWQMADSSNAQYFTVEKSENGVNWRILADMAANENAGYYTYVDSLPAKGLNYYRIKATDGGKTAYSISRRMYIGFVENLLTVYPNPVNKNLQFEMTALIKGRYRAVVFSLTGTKVAEKLIDHDGIDKYITIPLPLTISKGIYWVVLMTKSEFYKQNFLVQ